MEISALATMVWPSVVRIGRHFQVRILLGAYFLIGGDPSSCQ